MTRKQNHNALFKQNNVASKLMTKGARILGLWAPISVEMKQNIWRGAEEQEKCASAKYGLYCRFSTSVNTFVIDSIMLIILWLQHWLDACKHEANADLSSVQVCIDLHKAILPEIPMKIFSNISKITFNITGTHPRRQWVNERYTGKYNINTL